MGNAFGFQKSEALKVDVILGSLKFVCAHTYVQQVIKVVHCMYFWVNMVDMCYMCVPHKKKILGW